MSCWKYLWVTETSFLQSLQPAPWSNSAEKAVSSNGYSLTFTVWPICTGFPFALWNCFFPIDKSFADLASILDLIVFHLFLPPTNFLSVFSLSVKKKKSFFHTQIHQNCHAAIKKNTSLKPQILTNTRAYFTRLICDIIQLWLLKRQIKDIKVGVVK